VTGLITAAQALIESEVGRTLESDTHDQTLDGGQSTLFLKYWPVTAVASVDEDGTTLVEGTDFLFYEDGRLIRIAGGYQQAWRTSKPRSIDVTYTGGYLAGDHDSELEHLKSLCTEIVARAFRQGAANAVAPAGVGLGGITEVHLDGSDSVKYSTSSGVAIELGFGLTRFVFLLDDERAQLGRYKGALIR
jgi:hypothetical protein